MLMPEPDWLKKAWAKTIHRPKGESATATRARRKRYQGSKRATPGCYCSACRRLRERQASGRGDPMENAGEVQHGAKEKGWSMGSKGIDNPTRLFGHLRDVDVADREEREAYGKPLTACYREVIGPTPKCGPADVRTAKQFLAKIQKAIDTGEDDRDVWSSSEWARLYRMRDNWRRRANGQDARFMIVGNIGGTPQAPDRAAIKLQQQVADILEIARGKR